MGIQRKPISPGSLISQNKRVEPLVAPASVERLHGVVRYLVAVGLASLSIGLLWAILGAFLAAIGLDAGRELWWHAGSAIALVGGIILNEFVAYYDQNAA